MSRWNGWLVVGALSGLLAVGCDGANSNYKTAKELSGGKSAVDEHEHGAGPHGGAIVELGNDEYHAELVLDGQAHVLRVYMLGGDAKTTSPVTVSEITVVTEDNQSLKLPAKPQVGDTDGKSSLFELVDEKAVEGLEKAGYLHGSLQLEIAGKPYRGDIDAHFDGSAHGDHDHADHKEQPAAK